MPRDNDKNNGPSRGRPPGGKVPGKGGRSGAARGPEKKFAKRDGSYAPRPPRDGDGEKRSYAGKRDGDRAPRRDYGDAPRPRFNREDRPARSEGDRPSRGPRKEFGGGEKRSYAPRGDRPDFKLSLIHI